MASYPKIWTTIESEEWYQGSDCLTRGMIFQLILWCKKDGDTGHLEFRSWRFLAERAGVHHSTAKKIIVQLSKSKEMCRTFDTDLASKNFVEITERPDGTIHLFIPKYVESQQAKSSDELKKKGRKQAASGEICRTFSPKPNQIEPNQTEPKGSYAERTQERDCEYVEIAKMKDAVLNSEWKWAVDQNSANPSYWLGVMRRKYGMARFLEIIETLADRYPALGYRAPTDAMKSRAKIDEWCANPNMGKHMIQEKGSGARTKESGTNRATGSGGVKPVAAGKYARVGERHAATAEAGVSGDAASSAGEKNSKPAGV